MGVASGHHPYGSHGRRHRSLLLILILSRSKGNKPSVRLRKRSSLVLPARGRVCHRKRLGALDITHAAQGRDHNEKEEKQRQQPGQNVGRHLDGPAGARLGLETATANGSLRCERPEHVTRAWWGEIRISWEVTTKTFWSLDHRRASCGESVEASAHYCTRGNT